MTTENTEFKPTPTRDMQLFSLMQAMYAVGYQLMRTNNKGYVFLNASRQRNGDMLISVQNAVHLHNNPEEYNGKFDAYELNQLKAARVVVKCKLQYNKKTKSIYATGDLVRFVEPSYEDLFLGLEAQEE
jgi:hypothetical protein